MNSDDFSVWNTTQMHNGPVYMSTSSDCPNGNTNCWRLRGLGYIFVPISTLGFDTVKIQFDLRPLNTDNCPTSGTEYCQFLYTTDFDINGDYNWIPIFCNANSGQDITGNRENFPVSASNNAGFGIKIFVSDGDDDYCFVKRVYILGTVIPTAQPTTTSPTTSIPTTERPTSNPTLLPTTLTPTSIPISGNPSKSPSDNPSKAPSDIPTSLPTKSPSKSPLETPTNTQIDPTKYPSNNPTQYPAMIIKSTISAISTESATSLSVTDIDNSLIEDDELLHSVFDNDTLLWVIIAIIILFVCLCLVIIIYKKRKRKQKHKQNRSELFGSQIGMTIVPTSSPSAHSPASDTINTGFPFDQKLNKTGINKNKTQFSSHTTSLNVDNDIDVITDMNMEYSHPTPMGYDDKTTNKNSDEMDNITTPNGNEFNNQNVGEDEFIVEGEEYDNGNLINNNLITAHGNYVTDY